MEVSAAGCLNLGTIAIIVRVTLEKHKMIELVL